MCTTTLELELMRTKCIKDGHKRVRHNEKIAPTVLAKRQKPQRESEQLNRPRAAPLRFMQIAARDTYTTKVITFSRVN
jgi:hypothetical protein